MAGVCEVLRLCRQTLYRAINFLDRTCTVARVSRDKLRTFAAACLLIASKMQDQVDCAPPGISDFAELDETGKVSCRPSAALLASAETLGTGSPPTPRASPQQIAPFCVSLAHAFVGHPRHVSQRLYGIFMALYILSMICRGNAAKQ